MNQNVVSLAVLLGCIALGSASPPSHVKLCSRNSSPDQLSSCIKSSIQSLIPYLKTGNIGPGFTLKAMDPYDIGDFHLNQGFDLNLHNWKVYGFTTFQIRRVKAQLSPFKVDIELFTPKSKTGATYDLVFADMDLDTTGQFITEQTNFVTKMRFTGSKYMKGGNEYLRIDNVRVQITPGSLKVYMQNIADHINEYANENIQQFQGDMMPTVEEKMSKQLKDQSNKFLERATYDELFPDN